MMKFEEIWQDAIIKPLESVTIANGYENDLCFLNGWLVHYARDIARGENGWFFPSVGAHPDDEVITMQKRSSKHDSFESENSREFQIDIAVDITVDRITLLARMESALRDVKKAIATVKTGYVTLSRAKFTLPDDSEDYAFIIVSGNVKYNETW